jgi:hypothetical protein
LKGGQEGQKKIKVGEKGKFVAEAGEGRKKWKGRDFFYQMENFQIDLSRKNKGPAWTNKERKCGWGWGGATYTQDTRPIYRP